LSSFRIASTTSSLPYATLNSKSAYNFNSINDGFLHEFMKVVLAIELSEVFPDSVYIKTLMVLFQKCLEFRAQLVIGEGLVPQILDVVIEGLKGEDIQDLLQD